MKYRPMVVGVALICLGCTGGQNDAEIAAPSQGVVEPGATGQTIPLTLTADLTQQTVAKAICTRGNSFADISVDPFGRVAGRLTDTDRPIAGTLIARDPKTVELTVEQGAVSGETVGEAMQITTDGTRVYLTGSTFVCRGVQVRPSQ